MSVSRFKRADIFKFVGLLVFLLLTVLGVFLLAPYLMDIFEPGGVERLLDAIRDAGPAGVFVLLGLQLLQIVVAFIPGEVTQIAAGILYGPWWGSLLILAGCVVASALIYLLVHKMGAPFVRDIVPSKYLEKFREFEKTNKLHIIVFILFLIPGLPKDTFTYLVPLTDMRMRDFLLLSNIGRIPGILLSTYAADGLARGRIIESVIIFTIAAALAIAGVLFRERIMKALEKIHLRMTAKKAKSSSR